MSGVATAIAGTGLVSAVAGASASNKAAKAQQKGADQSVAEQRRQYDLTRQDTLAAQTQARTDLQPWMDAGQNALGNLSNAQTAFQASPDYAFRRSEGERGIGGSFAARGGAFSGNALKALSEYNSNLASGEFGNWWNRQAGVAGVGQNSASQAGQQGINSANALGQFGANAAGNIGNSLMAAGDARASGVMGQANSLSNSLNSGLNNYLAYRGGFFGQPRASSTAGGQQPMAYNWRGPTNGSVV